MKIFSRFLKKEFLTVFGIGALAMLIGAASRLFPLDFGSTPPVMRIVVSLLLLAWFGLCICFVLLGFSALHTVRIGRGEIHVCLGDLVLRRIPAERVKTVGVSMICFGRRRNRYRQHLLVLSARTADELDRKGKRFLHAVSTCDLAPFALRPVTGDHSAAKAYLLNSFFPSLLFMEYSPGAEEALRENLKNAEFLL